MTNSPGAGVELRKGSRAPRISSVPLYHSSAGDDAIQLAEVAGLFLDPWQQDVLRGALGERLDGKWSAFRVGLVLPRQNGKNAILEARELAGVLLFGEKLVMHTAHQHRTSINALKSLKDRIMGSIDLKELVDGYDEFAEDDDVPRGIKTGNNDPGIRFKNGNEIRYATRSKDAGRGFSGDLVVLDEAYSLKAAEMAALVPTLTSKSIDGNPQLWLTSSAGMVDSDALANLRESGQEKAKRLAYFEWSAPDDADNLDREAWYVANPALGYRISEEYIEDEYDTLVGKDGDDAEFRRERLGIWEPIGADGFIPPKKWAGCLDSKLAEMVVNGEVIDQKLTRVALGVDVPPDRSYGSVCVSGFREDGSHFVELLAREIGTDWLPGYLADLLAEGGKVPILADGFSAVSAMALELRQNRVPIKFIRSDVYKKACGVFYDKVVQGQVAHKGDADLDAAVAGAVPSSKDKLWAWTSKSVDVSPLVAATLAVHGSLNRPLGDKSSKRRGAVFA